MAKIVLIQVQQAPYAGVAYLNAAARSRGHQFVLHLGDDLRALTDTLATEKPDLVGFTCMSTYWKEILTLARAIRNHYAGPIVLGGPHATLFPEVINESCVDIICRGEGEYPLMELLDAIEHRQPCHEIKNLWVKHQGQVYKNDLRDLVDPMDQLPVIDWSCYQDTPVTNSAPIAFPIRGCPYSCTYCFNASMKRLYAGKGKYVRHFGVERAIQEIQAALKVFAPSPVLFTSDSFGMDLEWTERLLEEYKKVTDLPFTLLLRPELATEKFVKLLANYNCLSVAIGVESGSERVRQEIMQRNYSNKLLIEVAERLHRYGIKFRTYNMLGLPTETEQEMWETIKLNMEMKADYPRTTIFTPMPDTKIVEIAKQKGALDENFSFENLPKTVFGGSVLKNLDRAKLLNTLYFFQSLIVIPKLRQVFQKLMGLRPNPLFRAWFLLVYAYLHRKSEGRALLPYLKFMFVNRKSM